MPHEDTSADIPPHADSAASDHPPEEPSHQRFELPPLRENSTLLTLIGFVLLSGVASLIPDPWNHGEDLLALNARWPEGIPHPMDFQDRPDPAQIADASKTEATDPKPMVVAPVVREVEPKESEDDKIWRLRTEKVSEHNDALVTQLDEALHELDRPKIALELPCIARNVEGQCTARALDRFFLKLRGAMLERTAEPVRLSQYGDSLTSGDTLTKVVRELLQEEFGDGGYGYIPPAAPAPYMVHQGVRVHFDGDWMIDTIFDGSTPRDLGILGAAFKGPHDASASIESWDGEPRFERVGILYERQRGEGTVRLSIDGDSSLVKVKADPSEQATVLWRDLDPPAAKIDARFYNDGTTYFGVIAERTGGVVVDNLGIVSSGTRRFEAMEPTEWNRALSLRGTDMAIFFFGANIAYQHSMSDGAYKRFRREHAAIYKAARGPDHERDCLVMSILTRGSKKEGEIVRRPSVPQLVQLQREAAVEAGCAFWDTHAFLGGKGGTKEWATGSPRLLSSDYVHPTHRGYDVLGTAFGAAILMSFQEWLQDTDPAAILTMCQTYNLPMCEEIEE